MRTDVANKTLARRRHRRRRDSLVFLAAAGALLLLAGCASMETETRPAPPVTRVWPEPPAFPRVAYLKSISAPADLGIKRSGWSRFGRWLTGRNKAVESLDKPFGIALDEAGNLCVTDTGQAAVWYFDLAHNRARRWDKVGKVRFASPVAVARRNGLFFVADSGLAEVVVFDEGGKLRFTIKSGLARPSGLAIAEEKLFVADAQLHQVAVFDLNGKPLYQFGRRGTGPGEFNFPTHVSAGAPGQVLVTDSMNARVEVFDTAGRFQRVIGDVGDTSGHFSRPKGAAVDPAGHIYVVDALFDNIQIFDAQSRFLLAVGDAGSERGEFWLPNGIAVNRYNDIYVTDSYNHRVQILKYVGTE